MGRKIFQHKKGTLFVLIFAGLSFLFSSCSSRDSGVKTLVTNEIPQASQTSSTPVTPTQDTKELCVYITPKDSSGRALHVQDILRVAIVSKAGDELPAEPIGVSLIKICPTESRDYLMDALLTEAKNKRVYHATFSVSKEELQKRISKNVTAHEETESLVIQGPATVNTNAEVIYFASPAANMDTHSDLYTGVSSYFFYVSPKSAVNASQTSYDGLSIAVGNTGNLRLTIRCEAWSDTKGLLGYGVRTVLVTDPAFPTSAATTDTSTPNANDTASQKNTSVLEGTLTILDNSWYGTSQCPYAAYTVEIPDVGLHAKVLDAGAFRLENVPLGKHAVVVKKDGREKGRLDVNVTDITIQNIQIPVRC